MPVLATCTAAETSGVDPRITYTLVGFIGASGISHRRIKEAERVHGLSFPSYRIGRRLFIRGDAAIAWMEELSKRERQANGGDNQDYSSA